MLAKPDIKKDVHRREGRDGNVEIWPSLALDAGADMARMVAN